MLLQQVGMHSEHMLCLAPCTLPAPTPNLLKVFESFILSLNPEKLVQSPMRHRQHQSYNIQQCRLLEPEWHTLVIAQWLESLLMIWFMCCCRCAAYLNMQKYELAIEDATKALAMDSTYVKALHRRGTAYMKLQNFAAAATDFRKVSHSVSFYPLSKRLSLHITKHTTRISGTRISCCVGVKTCSPPVKTKWDLAQFVCSTVWRNLSVDHIQF